MVANLTKEEPSMSDLTNLAAEFKKWKGDLSYCRYPEHLWKKAYQLTDTHSLQAIASALGMSVQYLERKFAKRSKTVTFASVQVSPTPTPIKIEFKQMSIQVDERQAISMIQTLIGGV
jgi:AraC-like DNA-binding protein